ncbi:glycosyltransferase family 4 protein, partial [Desulfosarcina sp. OttesenSCG-928-G10]|nr:glycosyltransferase family 4 protein [Desulfosarcina sp. OttesenSCG-928-G10]MDL2321855.1 glycosyltransferase family 4 protein [Desulfosarcina sp. OttesenSCG-928-B08]
MKIGLVCRNFVQNRGGLEKDTVLLAEALVQKGHDVHVVCHAGDPQPGVTLHPVPFFPFSSPGKNLSFAYFAARQGRALKLDVLQSMERIWDQDIFRLSDTINPIQMAVKYPHPAVHFLKKIGPRRQVLSLLEKRIFEKNGAQFILAISNLVKTQILSHYHVPPEKIVVIYNSVDTKRFNPDRVSGFKNKIRSQFQIKPTEKLLLFLGNDFARKGLMTLLQALVKLKDQPVMLMVAGSDPPGWYLRFASGHGIGEKVRFIGYHAHPEHLYAAADLFVLPTSDDTFGNVCLEAMACGVPVITTRMAGASEVIDPGSTGYVLEAQDPEALSACITTFLQLPEPRAMGAAAAEKAGA